MFLALYAFLGQVRTVTVALFLSSVSDPDSSSPDLDPYPDPGFWWPKIGKNSTWKRNLILFWSKIEIYILIRLQKGGPSYRRSLQPSKTTSITSQHEISYFSFFVGHFCPPRSGSGFRIRITVFTNWHPVRLCRFCVWSCCWFFFSAA
jgi:hypothetical protein